MGTLVVAEEFFQKFSEDGNAKILIFIYIRWDKVNNLKMKNFDR